MLAVAAKDEEFDPMTVPARWQTHFYRSYLAHALKKLANDPNPDVQRIGRDMNKCLDCPRAERCSDCPFNPSGLARLGNGPR